MKPNTHFFIISLSDILRMGNVADKVVKEIKTQILGSVTFFSKVVPFMR
jgi:hypothetical protein